VECCAGSCQNSILVVAEGEKKQIVGENFLDIELAKLHLRK